MKEVVLKYLKEIAKFLSCALLIKIGLIAVFSIGSKYGAVWAASPSNVSYSDVCFICVGLRGIKFLLFGVDKE